MKPRQEYALASSLRACGHFLYYQTGGKAGQRRILVILLDRKGLTQKELQDVLEISSGALSEILQKMEEAAMVVREKSCDDKRQVMLSLTPAGEAMAHKVKAHYADMLARMFECLDAVEKEQLERTLGKLVRHLDTLKITQLLGAREESPM